METTDKKTESSGPKTYPHSEEDIKYEAEIIDEIKKLPLEQRIQFIALNNITLKKKQLEEELDFSIDRIVERYNKIEEPLFDRCNQIISGEAAPKLEELGEGKAKLKEEEVAQFETSATATPIPEYWFKVLTSCVRLSQDVFETDHPLLKHITKIEHIPENETENFVIRFHFSKNEYFENESLQVKFYMIDENEPLKSEGTEIKWKEGKNITKKTIEKKQKNKKTGKTRTVTKEVDADSFFVFFKTVIPKEDAAEGKDDEEEGGDEELERLQINYDIALTLQEEIISYHLEYYLGLRKGDEEYGGMDFGGEDDDDDEGDDDDEDDAPKGKKALPKAAGDKPKAGEKPECKQQ